MSKELVVSSTPHETRVAILEDDRLSEVYVERASEQAIAGGIYKGRINRVLPGMQSAFVKIGLERDAFLYVTDIVDETEQIESGELDDSDEVASEPKGGPRAATVPPDKPSEGSEETAEAEGERKRRRGRRSRRRRGRASSNFPDAKFADLDKTEEETSIEEPDPEADESAVGETPAAAAAAQEESFELLPGESLAKYESDEEEEEAQEPSEAEVETDEGDVDDEYEEGADADDSDAEEPGDEDADEDYVVDDAEWSEDDSEDDDAEEEDVPSPDEESSEDTEDDHPNNEVEGSEEEPVETEERSEASVRARDESQLVRRGRRGRRRRGRGGRGRNEERKEANSKPEDAADGDNKATGENSVALISDLIKPGQEIIVQVAKEPLGRKGARITAHVALPGRYVVYMPTVAHTGISRKIGSEAERNRLRRIIKENSEGVPGGFIVRTAGQGAEEADLIADLTFLANLWKGIQEKAEKRSAPALLHADLDIVERILRDHLGQSYKTIWVDSEDEYERVVRFVERFQPELLDRVKLYTRRTPIFDKFNITQDLEKALRPKVWLKSGGYLVINQTEALVAVDVNTGKYVGKSDRLEDTIVKTNLEAAEEIVRQMRLRDLGGIIVIDFIDMDDRSNRKRVLQALEAALRSDRAPSKALNFNDFGLVAITRKRVKQSLERALCSPCPACQGSGHVQSVPTVIYNLLGEARRMGKLEDPERGVVVRCNPDVAKELKSRSNSFLQEMEELFGASVIVRSDVALARNHFDID